MAAPSERTPRQQWEYTSAFMYSKMEGGAFSRAQVPYLNTDGKDYKGPAVMQKLNELGWAGWEMISVAPLVGSQSAGFALNLVAMDPVRDTTTQGYYLWFKRLK